VDKERQKENEASLAQWQKVFFSYKYLSPGGTVR
jgi:hypothetical protein